MPSDLQLADPQFNTPSEVDILIDVDLFWKLLCIGQIEASVNHPTLQKTRLGWVLAGRAFAASPRANKVRALSVSVSNARLQDQLAKFWQLEEVTCDLRSYTSEERACEAHFKTHTIINNQGRYVVKLPVKEEVLRRVGDTKEIALRRFFRLERRFQHDAEFKAQYVKFTHEYMELSHMKIVSPSDQVNSTYFYLPHHDVLKQGSQGSKMHVVFDASCKSTTGVSLNDALMVGPVVQQDLMAILIRFRTRTFVFTADIVKMYRQLLVHDSQIRLQRIWWRDNADAPIETYELQTVTYGTSSASFLAKRYIQHLAQHHALEFSRGSACALRDSYIDDLLTEADTIKEAKITRDEVARSKRRGQFELSKWRSNHTELI